MSEKYITIVLEEASIHRRSGFPYLSRILRRIRDEIVEYVSAEKSSPTGQPIIYGKMDQAQEKAIRSLLQEAGIIVLN